MLIALALLVGCGLTVDQVAERAKAATKMEKEAQKLPRPCTVTWETSLDSFIFHVPKYDWDALTPGAREMYVNHCQAIAENHFTSPDITIAVNFETKAIKSFGFETGYFD